MGYAVKEIYYTLQGEGAHVGRPAVFCRFSGCNLWTGLEKDRAKAICDFCDTDFVGTDGPSGGRFSEATQLAAAIAQHWPLSAEAESRRFVVCTGGEPLLQMDSELVDRLHDFGFEVAVETNGTRLPPPNIDWICCSPKAGSDLVLRSGNELKLVFPQPGLNPEDLAGLDFDLLFLQPMSGAHFDDNVGRATRYCLANPRWRLCLQTHKLLGLR